MLFSLALILIIGFTLSGILKRLRLPGILGMLITGVILGPFVLNLISPDILNISKDLRQIALIVILSRAGLSLYVNDLKKVRTPAILMCFVPATFELVAITLLAPILFKVSYIEAAIMGTVLAAVSPAVVVPRMLKVMEGGYGKEKSIPQLILAVATVQAAIGSIPLSAGVLAGNTILTVAVFAILVTAPIGAIGIDMTYKKLLTKEHVNI